MPWNLYSNRISFILRAAIVVFGIKTANGERLVYHDESIMVAIQLMY